MEFGKMTTPTVFFDLDGTLVDSVHDVHLCLNSVLGEHGRTPLSLSLWLPLSWGEVLKLYLPEPWR